MPLGKPTDQLLQLKHFVALKHQGLAGVVLQPSDFVSLLNSDLCLIRNADVWELH